MIHGPAMDPRSMKQSRRPVDECLIASSQIIATARDRLARMRFSLDACLSSIEISADAIAASQALLAKLDGNGVVIARDGAGALSGIDSPASEQTSDGAASA